jgi:hypothetical protein
LADSFGPQAVEWTLNTVATPLALEHRGTKTEAVAFRRHRRLSFGAIGNHRVYEFGFPEQVFLPATLAVPSVRGWFTLKPSPAAGALSLAARAGMLRPLLAHPRARRALVRLSGRLPARRRGGLVGATAVARNGVRTASVSLSTRSEAHTTARCAAALIDLWDHGRPGCHLPETVIAPTPFFEALAGHGIRISHSHAA